MWKSFEKMSFSKLFHDFSKTLNNEQTNTTYNTHVLVSYVVFFKLKQRDVKFCIFKISKTFSQFPSFSRNCLFFLRIHLSKQLMFNFRSFNVFLPFSHVRLFFWSFLCTTMSITNFFVAKDFLFLLWYFPGPQ